MIEDTKLPLLLPQLIEKSSEVKLPPPAESGTLNIHNSHNNNKPDKLSGMLSVFATGRRLHRFTAEEIGDHCLPTTICDLQDKYFLSFSRDWLAVPNRFGSKTRVRVYWLEGEHIERAKAIIDEGARP